MSKFDLDYGFLDARRQIARSWGRKGSAECFRTRDWRIVRLALQGAACDDWNMIESGDYLIPEFVLRK